MLKTLRIQNYALIKDMTLQFESGLNVLTGETGAGKTILLEALGLVLGKRAGSQYVRPGHKKGVVEALFELEIRSAAVEGLKASGLLGDDNESSPPRNGTVEILLRREISSEGRGRAFINGSPSTITLLRQLGTELVQILGQGGTGDLMAGTSWLQLLDRFAGTLGLRKDLEELFVSARAMDKELEELCGDPLKREQRVDFLKFQIQEIRDAALKTGEEASVAQELKILSNATKIQESLASAMQSLEGMREEGGAIAGLGKAAADLGEAHGLGAKTGSLAESLQALEESAHEILRELGPLRGGSENNPGRQTELEQRLDLIRNLEKKYGTSTDKVIEAGNILEQELAKLEESDDRVAVLRKDRKEALARLIEINSELGRKRKKAAGDISASLETELEQLHLKQAKIKLDLGPRSSGGMEIEPGVWMDRDGSDILTILFQANPDHPAMALDLVASGGELARVCLGLMVVMGTDSGVSSYIFDEIDAGIGGEAVWSVGRRLGRLGETAQVMVVTHQAAVARFGNHHIKITKTQQHGETHVDAGTVSGKTRVDEIARMMGGDELGPVAVRHAKDLLRSESS